LLASCLSGGRNKTPINLFKAKFPASTWISLNGAAVSPSELGQLAFRADTQRLNLKIAYCHYCYRYYSDTERGRAIVQVVNCRLPTAATHVRSQVTFCGIYVRQSGTKVGFLLELQFPLPILSIPTAPHSLIISSSTLYSVDADSVVQ
jgi:hypothetical protein